MVKINIDVIKNLEIVVGYILRNGWYILLAAWLLGAFIKHTPKLNAIADFIPAINAILWGVLGYFLTPFKGIEIVPQIIVSASLAYIASPLYDKLLKPFENVLLNNMQSKVAKACGIESEEDDE